MAKGSTDPSKLKNFKNIFKFYESLIDNNMT